MANSVTSADEDGQRDIKLLDMNCIHRYFRTKTLYSVICCSTSFMLGWFFKLTGPSLLELQLNTGVTFTMASTYITAFNVNQIIGSLGIGFFLYQRVNAFLLIVISLTISTASLMTIPLCLAYIPMMVSHVGFGISAGGLDMLVIAEMSALWGSDTEVPMHALYFTSALGSVLSPICITPYLKKLEDIYELSGRETLNSTINSRVSHCINSSIQYDVIPKTRCIKQQALETPSRLYIPYNISAGLAVIILLPTLVIFILYIKNKFKVTYNHEDSSPEKKQISGKSMCVALLIIGQMSFLDTSIEESFGDFLPSFCVTHMGWSSQSSAYVVSVFGVSIAIGRLVGILLTQVPFSSIKLMTSYCILLTIAHILLVVSGINSLDYGIWIGSFLSGFGVSVLSPCIFTLTEEHFFPISGKIAAYLVMVSSLGTGLNSLLIGYLMDNISNMYFTYVLLIESIVYLFLILICVVMIRLKQNINDELSTNRNTHEPSLYITHL